MIGNDRGTFTDIIEVLKKKKYNITERNEKNLKSGFKKLTGSIELRGMVSVLNGFITGDMYIPVNITTSNFMLVKATLSVLVEDCDFYVGKADLVRFSQSIHISFELNTEEGCAAEKFEKCLNWWEVHGEEIHNWYKESEDEDSTEDSEEECLWEESDFLLDDNEEDNSNGLIKSPLSIFQNAEDIKIDRIAEMNGRLLAFEETESISGSIIKVEKLSKGVVMLDIDLDGVHKETIYTNSKSTIKTDIFKTGKYICGDIIRRGIINYASGVFPIEDEELFSHITDKPEKMKLVKTLNSLDESIREKILKLRATERTRNEGLSSNSKLSDISDFRVKYELCRHLYTDEQQRTIEHYFDEVSPVRTVSDKRDSIAFRRLKTLMNIDCLCLERRDVSPLRLKEGLDKWVYGMERVKEEIVESFASGLNAKKRGIKILLVGSPGVGKTSIATAIARLYGIPYMELSLGGVDTSDAIMGTPACFKDANVGQLISGYYTIGTTEAVVLLDEIDKMGMGVNNGSPASALLDTLSDRNICFDAFLETYIKTDNTIYIATANNTDNIPDYLLNRFDSIIYIEDYTDEEKLVIARDFIIPSLCSDLNIDSSRVDFNDEAIEYIINNYIYEGGIRSLKSRIRTVFNSVVCRMESREENIVIDADRVCACLEPKINKNDPIARYRRNINSFSPKQREAIHRIFHLINSGGLGKNEISKERERLEYFLDLSRGCCGIADTDIIIESLDSKYYGLKREKEEFAKAVYTASIRKGKKAVLVAGLFGTDKKYFAKAAAEGLNMPITFIRSEDLKTPVISNKNAGPLVKKVSERKTAAQIIYIEGIESIAQDKEALYNLYKLVNEPECYYDAVLEGEIDFSQAVFIASSETPYTPATAFFDTVILSTYSSRDKKAVLKDYIIPSLCERYGVKANVDQKAIDIIAEGYCRGEGAAALENAADKAFKEALYEDRGKRNITITEGCVKNALGEVPCKRGNFPKSSNMTGISRALAILNNGGGISLPVETRLVPEPSYFEISGLPKETVIDSVKLARSFIMCKYPHIIENKGLHIHFGDGGVEKKGSSAGVAVLVSMLSAVLERPVGNCAFTGEIDLMGNIFTVGGVREKLIAAEAAGCEAAFVPEGNYRGFEDRYSDINIKIIPVSHIDDVTKVIWKLQSE